MHLQDGIGINENKKEGGGREKEIKVKTIY